MSLYRSKAGDGVAWITGASTGIGKAVALELASLGYEVVATARGREALDTLALESADMPGSIHAAPGDVTDRELMAGLVRDIEKNYGPITLAIFNAGSYFPTRGEAMDIDAFENTYKINLFGILYGLVPVVEQMKALGRGQVVLVASVSGYSGLPAASAYGASKAAIINMAESLKFDFDKLNIRIQVVNPGFIDTPATQKNDFEMPALMPVDDAADAMVRGILTGGFEMTFPRRFTYAVKFLSVLPHRVYFWLMNRSTRWPTRPLDFGDTTPSRGQQGS